MQICTRSHRNNARCDCAHSNKRIQSMHVWRAPPLSIIRNHRHSYASAATRHADTATTVTTTTKTPSQITGPRCAWSSWVSARSELTAIECAHVACTPTIIIVCVMCSFVFVFEQFAVRLVSRRCVVVFVDGGIRIYVLYQPNASALPHVVHDHRPYRSTCERPQHRSHANAIGTVIIVEHSQWNGQQFDFFHAIISNDCRPTVGASMQRTMYVCIYGFVRLCGRSSMFRLANMLGR